MQSLIDGSEPLVPTAPFGKRPARKKVRFCEEFMGCADTCCASEAPVLKQQAEGESSSKSDTPLLTAQGDASLGSTLGKGWVSCVSEGVGMGVDRGDRVKHPGYVCAGGLDTNDLDEAEDYVDGGMSSGYVDDRTGLMLGKLKLRRWTL